MYLALAGVLLGTVLLHPNQRVVGNAELHVWDHVWHCWWLRYAVEHGVSPFFSSLIDFPRGVSVMGEMSTLTFPVLSVPLQYIFGLVGSYNLMALAFLALAGFGGYLVCRRVASDNDTSLLGGVIYGFSPFIQVEMSNGMMEQVVGTALLPYFMLALLAINDRPQKGNTSAAVALLALLALTSLQTLVFAALLSPFCLLHGWTTTPPGGRRRLLTAYGIVALAGLAALTSIVTSLAVTHASLTRDVDWRSSADNPLLKSKVCLDVIRLISSAASGFSGGTAAGGTVVLVPFGVYMGKVVALLSALALVFTARVWRPWKIGLLSSVLIALGPYLNIGGRTELAFGARVPLPDFFVLTVVPQASRLLAGHNYRFMSLAMLFAALLSTLMLGVILSGLRVGAVARRATVAALCWFALVDFGFSIARPQPLTLPSAGVAVPSAYAALAGKADGAVFDVPLPYAHTSSIGLNGLQMFYQTRHGRPIWAGGADTSKPEKRDLALVRAARRMSVGQEWRLDGEELLDDCAEIYRMGYRYVALHRDQMTERDGLRFRELAEKNLGKPLTAAAGVAIYELPSMLKDRTERAALISRGQ